MPVKLLVQVKGGAGSGNWGHAGRPGIRGGSSTRSNPQARVGATRQRLKLATIDRKKRAGEKRVVVTTTKDNPVQIGNGIETVQNIGNANMGGGGAGSPYIITNAGSIAYSTVADAQHKDILQNGHELFGLESGFELTSSMVDTIFDQIDAGSVFVRVMPNQVSVKGAGLSSPSGLRRLQDWILVDNKLPRNSGAQYAISDIRDGGRVASVVTDLDSLLTAQNFRDL